PERPLQAVMEPVLSPTPLPPQWTLVVASLISQQMSLALPAISLQPARVRVPRTLPGAMAPERMASPESLESLESPTPGLTPLLFRAPTSPAVAPLPSPSAPVPSFSTAMEPSKASLLPLLPLVPPLPPTPSSPCHPQDPFSPTAPIHFPLPGTCITQPASGSSRKPPPPAAPVPSNRMAPAAAPCRISALVPMAPLPGLSATEPPLPSDRSGSPASPTSRASRAMAIILIPQPLPPASPPSARRPAADLAAFPAMLSNNPTSTSPPNLPTSSSPSAATKPMRASSLLSIRSSKTPSPGNSNARGGTGVSPV